MEKATDRLSCVQCGRPAPSLYRQYSRDVVKLAECADCGQLVDKYIEYDKLLVYIDLVLQYTAAYRHVFLNTVYESFWRVGAVFVMFSAYRKWALQKEVTTAEPDGFYSLEWRFYECLLESTVEIVAYSAVTCALVKLFKLQTNHSMRTIFGITSCGFYGYVFVVLAVVWKLHTKLEYTLLTQGFILLSHFQIQRVLCPSPWLLSAFVVFMSQLAFAAAGYLCHFVVMHLSKNYG